MIREIAVELAAALAAQGCPFEVSDEDIKAAVTVGRPRVIVEHDEAGDKFGPPRGAHRNPRHHYTATTGGKITIYAQASKTGTAEFEHRRLALRTRDRVLGAMRLVAANRLNGYKLIGGKFVPLADLENSERLSGAVYVLTFTFDNAVEQRTWAGSAQPEHTLGAGGITSRTAVSLRGDADDDDDPNTPPATAETACGA